MKCNTNTISYKSMANLWAQLAPVNHGGASVLPVSGSEHVDNVGQKHKADDGEEHQQ